MDRTDLSIVPDPNHGGGSKVVKQDGRTEDQQVPAQIASTPTPRHDSGNASECGQLKLFWPTLTPYPYSIARTR